MKRFVVCDSYHEPVTGFDTRAEADAWIAEQGRGDLHVVERSFPICARCRMPIDSMRGVVTADDGALFHGRCWRNV